MMTNSNITHVVVTGIDWLGGGIGSIETAINWMFREADNEILISAYSIGNAADIILNIIEGALSRGVIVKLLVNRLADQPTDVIDTLNKMNNKFPHFSLYHFLPDESIDLHAKVIVVDQKIALVGSSNLSRRGLISNYEMGILIEGSTAGQVADAFYQLLSSKYVILI